MEVVHSKSACISQSGVLFAIAAIKIPAVLLNFGLVNITIGVMSISLLLLSGALSLYLIKTHSLQVARLYRICIITIGIVDATNFICIGALVLYYRTPDLCAPLVLFTLILVFYIVVLRVITKTIHRLQNRDSELREPLVEHRTS